MNIKLISLSIIFLAIVSCTIDEPASIGEVEGLRPIYLTKAEVGLVATNPPNPFKNLGKIVSVGNYIFINERYEGIHVINNTEPQNPITEFFWFIPGNSEFTIDGNFLYADNGFDLYTIDITDLAAIQLVDTLSEIYGGADTTPNFPPDYFGNFECVDHSKGIAIGWEEAILNNPKCSR